MRTFKASAIQAKSGPERASNLEAAARGVAEAARAGAALAVLPEMYPWRGPQADEPAQAETVPGPTSRAAAEMARASGVYLVAGSMLERGPDPSHCFNTSLVFDPGGRQIAGYRKIHLFDVDLAGRVSISESKTRAAGDTPVCVDTDLGRIGLSICYDLRFPELYRTLADAGAEVIVVPSAFTAPTGEAHWEPLLRARAIENQSFVVAANQFGPTKYGFADYGNSMIVDPWGAVLARGGGDKAEVLTAELDADTLERVRRELPSLRHRRLGR